jgi:hypothetical protein
MLLELLIDASVPVRETRLARLLRDIDRTLAAMADLDAREERHRRAACALPRISPPAMRPSMAASAGAKTSAPPI